MFGNSLDDRAFGVLGFAHKRLSLANAVGATLNRCPRFLTLLALPTLAACQAPLSTLDPVGPSAASIADLWWVMFWGAVALFVLVMALLALTYLRPSLVRPIAPKRWIALGGLAMPGVILVALVGYALYAGEKLLAHPGPDVVRVSAQGQMWSWRFTYPHTPEAGETAQLHIPARTPVDVVVTTTDVIHSFWVPRLAGKIDAIPGHDNIIRIEADRPGAYQGVCAEFCGAGHTQMRFVIIVHPPEDYATALMEAGQ